MDDHGVGARKPFSWLNPVPLWQSRNDRVARLFGDPVNAMRVKWMELLGSPADLVIDRSAESPISFLVIGDTGEGDASQWVGVPPLQAVGRDTAFMFVCSDVIYPAGGVNDYRDRFFDPYDWYENPIYAVPGNHDWYDDGAGFMRWFCGTRERLPARTGSTLHQLLRLLRIWRRAPRVDETAEHVEDEYAAAEQEHDPQERQGLRLHHRCGVDQVEQRRCSEIADGRHDQEGKRDRGQERLIDGSVAPCPGHPHRQSGRPARSCR